MKPVLESVSYEVRADGKHVELVVTSEWVQFVAETIPDGQMAGMPGHRMVPATRETVYPLHRAQAKELQRRLGEVLGELS